MNMKIIVFSVVILTLGLFLKNVIPTKKEKLIVTITEKNNQVELSISNQDNKDVKVFKLNNLSPLTVVNADFSNSYSLQNNAIVELLSNSECTVNVPLGASEKYILATCMSNKTSNPILRFLYYLFSEKNKDYLIYCVNGNTTKKQYTTKKLSFHGLFKGSYNNNIKILGCGNQIEDISYMFASCNNLTNLDLSNLNITNVQDMDYMFKDCFKDNESIKLTCSGYFLKKIIEKIHYVMNHQYKEDNFGLKISEKINDTYNADIYKNDEIYTCTIFNHKIIQIG